MNMNINNKDGCMPLCPLSAGALALVRVNHAPELSAGTLTAVKVVGGYHEGLRFSAGTLTDIKGSHDPKDYKEYKDYKDPYKENLIKFVNIYYSNLNIIKIAYDISFLKFLRLVLDGDVESNPGLTQKFALPLSLLP